ncbi:MAG: hypothetical protein JWP59_4776 [Massilia sp.]|nr:hypothetical protein [Massilia sp.]
MNNVTQLRHQHSHPVVRPEKGPAQARLIRECREIEAAIDSTGMLRTEHDAERVARNLTDLLDEARRLADVRRSSVAERVWGGKGIGDPSKRLYKLTLPRATGLGAEEQREQARLHRKHLQRHADRYATVAKALTEEMDGRPGWGRQEILVRLFRDTAVDRKLGDLVASRTAASTDPDNCWQELAARMQQIAAWVTRETGLHGHLARITSTRGCYDLANDVIKPNKGLLLPHGPLHGNFEVSEEFPPIPSVRLIDELIADVACATLTLEREEGAEPAPLTVRARVWRELRLAVGPADVPEQAAALFEVRTRVSIETKGGPLAVSRPWIYLPGWDVEVEVDGTMHRGELDLGAEPPGGGDWRDLLAWSDFEDTGQPLQPEHCYAAWRLVTSKTCQELLANQPMQEGRFWLPFEPMDMPTLAPEGSIGAQVELALVAPEGPRVDLALRREARHLVALVEGYVADRRLQAMQMHDQAAARWSAGSAAEAADTTQPSDGPGPEPTTT